MIKIGSWKKSLKYRYIFSYTVVVLIPLLIMMAIFYNNSISTLKNDIENVSLRRLEQTRDTFENRLKDLYAISYAVSVDERLKPEYLLQTIYNDLEAVGRLKMHNSKNTIASGTYLYMFANQTVYAEDGTMSMYALTNVLNKFAPVDAARFTEIAETVTEPLLCSLDEILTAKPQQDTLIFMHPLTSMGSPPYGVLIYQINDKNIISLFADAMVGVQGNILILDQNRHPLLESGQTSLPIDSLSGRLDQFSGIISYPDRNVDYSVIYTTSAANGWKYLMILPADQFLLKVVRQKTLMIQIGITLLMLGLCIAFFFAMMNYKPIGKLMKAVRLDGDPGSPQEPVNELETIKTSINSYIDRNNKLRQLVDLQRPYVKEYLIEQLIDGGIDRDTIHGILKNTDIQLERLFYLVLVVDCSRLPEGLPAAKFRNQVIRISLELEKEWAPAYSIYPIDRNDENVVAIVANYDDNSDEASFLQAVIEKIEYECGGNPAASRLIIGVGHVKEEISDVAKAFLEARAAIENARMKGLSGLAEFASIAESQPGVYNYPVNEQRMLLQSIKQGNAEAATQCLSALYEQIAVANHSPLILKYVFFDLINSIVKIINDLKLTEYDETIRTLMQFNCMDELRASMQLLVHDLCVSINRSKNSRHHILRDQLLAYVTAHFTESDISLESIAEAFSLSPYYISRFFGEQTGSALKDYITELRIDLTKRLLRESDKSLKDIVGMAGYLNVSSFIKKFRLLEGITPGEYRRVYHPDQKDEIHEES